jgi:phosphohistidine swiveling domain-containing protein
MSFAGLNDKYEVEAATPTVRMFHAAIRARMAERFEASGKSWEEFVFDPRYELGFEDLATVEREMLDAGYQFDFSAQVSQREEPEKYKGVQTDDTERPEAIDAPLAVGSGDNVYRTDADLEGIAREISTLERVMEMLTDGVPEHTIAIIDDSGGTMTAPIMQGFKAMICLEGTIRSHLAILSREFGIPCLMAAEVKGLRDGDRVRIETTKPVREMTPEAMAAQATLSGEERALIWRIP